MYQAYIDNEWNRKTKRELLGEEIDIEQQKLGHTQILELLVDIDR